MKPIIFLFLAALILLVFLIVLLGSKASKRKNAYKSDAMIEYTVLITDSFSSDDNKVMRPIFTLVFKKDGFRQEAVLCRILNNEGEISLKEAEDLMLHNISYSFENNVFIDSKVHTNDLIEQEKAVANKLYEEVTKRKK